MAVMTVQDRSQGAGAPTTYAAVTASDTIPTASRAGGWGDTVLIVRNGGAGATVVTVAGFTGVSVAAAGVEVFPVGGHSGGAIVTYSVTTSVTAAAVKVA